MSNPLLTFQSLPGRYAICRLPADSAAPDWSGGEIFSSVTRTPDELSIVVLQDAVPPGVPADRNWAAFRIVGPLSLDETGIASSVTSLVAELKVPVFVVSTYDTDYFLVPAGREEDVFRAMRAIGHTILKT